MVTSTTTKKPLSEPEEEVELDLYQEYKGLEKQLEFIELQEEYLKDEMRHLQRELLRAKEEIRRIQSVPLVIGNLYFLILSSIEMVSQVPRMLQNSRIIDFQREKLPIFLSQYWRNLSAAR